MSHPNLNPYLLSFSAEILKWLYYLFFICTSSLLHFLVFMSSVFLTAFCHSLSSGGCNGRQRLVNDGKSGQWWKDERTKM